MTPLGEDKGRDVRQVITIDTSPAEVYAFWRDFENLPRFMEHLESVVTSDATHSHWKAKAPAGTTVEWDAEVVRDEPEQVIAWRSVGDTSVPNSGEVRFVPGTGNRGTQVFVSLNYQPPAGIVGATVARLFGQEPSGQIEHDLRRLRAVLEAGEVPTTDGQSHGERSVIGKLANRAGSH